METKSAFLIQFKIIIINMKIKYRFYNDIMRKHLFLQYHIRLHIEEK